MSEVSEDDVRAALTPEVVRALQIVHLALGMGVLGFAGVVTFLHLQNGGAVAKVSPEEHENRLAMMRTFSFVNVTLAASAIGGAFIVPTMQLAAIRGTADAAGWAGALRSSAIVRAALLESSALFGLVTCFLASTNGVLASQPELALNALPAAGFLLFLAAAFPTQERLVERFRRARAS